MYAAEVREAVSGSIDTGKLAEAWAALHPQDVGKSAPGAALSGGRGSSPSYRTSRWSYDARTSPAQGQATKAIPAALAAFLGRARTAISDALKPVLTRLATEAWVLGNRSALAAVDSLADVDWGGWKPGDYAAAEQIAGPGLRQLLDEQGIRIKSIAESRLEELSQVLEDTLRSDEIRREPTGPLPPFLSVGDLAGRLRTVLDNPDRAELVAQAEIARAQASAARQVYAETGRTEVEVSTAEDDKVCPICDAARKLGAHPLGAAPLIPLHPRCRCAELPVLESSGPVPRQAPAPPDEDDEKGYLASLDYDEKGGAGGGSITAYEADPKAYNGRLQVGHINWGADDKVHDLGSSHDRHRRGIASELWRRALEMTGGKLSHAENRTASGEAFARRVGGKTPPRSDWRPK